MLFFDSLQDMVKPGFFKFHHVVMRFDPRHLHVYAGEFGGMSGRKGWIRTKGRTNLKDAVETRRHCHLFIELGRLCQRGGLPEIFQCEKFRATFAWAPHNFLRLELHRACWAAKLTHRHLKPSLDS